VWLASTGIAQPTLRLCEKGTTMMKELKKLSKPLSKKQIRANFQKQGKINKKFNQQQKELMKAADLKLKQHVSQHPTLRTTREILAYIDNKLSMLAWDAFDEQEQRLLLSIESHIGQRTNEAEI
jgi:hypothetical protein